MSDIKKMRKNLSVTIVIHSGKIFLQIYSFSHLQLFTKGSNVVCEVLSYPITVVYTSTKHNAQRSA